MKETTGRRKIEIKVEKATNLEGKKEKKKGLIQARKARNHGRKHTKACVLL